MTTNIAAVGCCCGTPGFPCTACNQPYNNPPSAVSLAHTVNKGFSFSFNSGSVTIPCPTKYEFTAVCPQVTLPGNRCGWSITYTNIQQPYILASGIVSGNDITYVLGWYQAGCSWSSFTGTWIGKIDVGVQAFKTGLPFTPANSMGAFNQLNLASLSKSCTTPINPFGVYFNGTLACNGSATVLEHLMVVS